jgi:hypothetical protein
MSYLHLPRLIFSGDFKSDVSTVNNDPAHYNNATFQPSFQEPQDPNEPPPNNGWWNPEGGASFDFVNCKVEQITLPDGSTQADDIIIGCSVGSPNDRAGGKMVDLDPQQQMVSQLWGVVLRISTAQGELLLQGDVKPVGFRDLQRRQSAGARVNGQPLGGTWTTVLTNIEWGEKASSSPFLKNLRAITQGDKLSLNLNAFGYYYNHAADGRFSLGRIIGSIAPWFEGEPEFFAPARRLYGILPVIGRVYFNFSNFLLESQQKRLTIDFGSSFPVADALGTINNPVIPSAGWIIKAPQKYIVAVINPPVKISYGQDRTPQILGKDEFTEIGELNFQTGKDWLNKTGGIVVFDNLSDVAIGLLSNRPNQQQLVLLAPSSAGPEQYVLIAREAINGFVIRADNFVQRLDYNQTNKVDIYAYQYGIPLAFQDITVSLEAPTPVTPLSPNNPISEVPGNNYPQDGLSFYSLIQTDANGRARLDITGNAINSPRIYIDGQIYYLDYQIQNNPNDPVAGSMVPENISIHLRDYFEVPENPTWNDISEIMTQYSNLYPIMSKYVVDLSDPVAVKAKKNLLIFAFTRDISDPIHMPVTRDLSEAKRQAILKWLEAPELPPVEKAMSLDKSLTANAVKSDAKLTDKQIKLKNLVKVKSGADFLFSETTELSED